MTGIVVEHLSKSYRRGLAGDRVQALAGVSLTIAPGESFGIIGPNGAGKTTFLGCLLGFLRPDAGRITIEGRNPDDLEVRSVTGYLPERLVMDRWMSGRDFLDYHHALARLPVDRRESDVEVVLGRVGLDRESGARAIRGYSRGMLQRIGLAQALLGRPRFVFLDEPASGVDPAGVLLFRRVLGELKSSGATVVLNSHQLEQVERVCDRVAFVNRGRVEAIETLAAGTTHARGLRVRWAGGTTRDRHAAYRADSTARDAVPKLSEGSGGPAVTRDTLVAGARRAGAELVDTGEREARFRVDDDDAAARLVQSLVAAGVPVIEVLPDESRLERLFVETPGASRRAVGAAAATEPATPGAPADEVRP